ncbi:MAG: hypothetical protein ACYSWQ_00275 [Planctomycetota bacterium]|jgi:hypothetical protein
MGAKRRQIGRARIALVFGVDGHGKAIVSVVTARTKRHKKGLRLTFVGQVKFAEASVAHIHSVVLPIVDEISDQLGVSRKVFEVSAVNVGAASCRDLSVAVSGTSADAPVLLAMLSAGLRMPMRDDFVATGHIASRHGDISAVKSIPAKVKAAAADSSIKRFIYGDLRGDSSFDVLSPKEKDAALTAILQAGNGLTTRAVRGVDELIYEAFSGEDIVLSSLERGFFHINRAPGNGRDPIERAVDLLTDCNDRRFWRLVQENFSTGQSDQAMHMLETYARSFECVRRYPSSLGASLLQLVCTLPPAIRRLKLPCPLLPFSRCIRLAGFVKDNDVADVPLLFDAVRVRVPGSDEAQRIQRSPLPSTQSECSLFDTVTAEISEQALAKKFGIPIDSARASFVLASSTVESYDEFIEIVESFFVHLQGYLNADIPAVSNLQLIGGKVLALLEATFRSYGGPEGAFAQARDGTDGGLRSVLDAMTEQYKKQLQTEEVNVVLEKALADMDWSDRVDFTKGAMKRLGPFLPHEIRQEPPDRFARSADEIARAYVRSVSSIQKFLSTL